MSDKAPEPWYCEPGQRDRLKREAETECGLVGVNWIVPILGHPLIDDQPDSVLDHERPAEMQEVQSTIGTGGDFYRKVICYDRIAQDGGSPYN